MPSHFYCFLITAQGGSRLITDPPPPPSHPTIPLSFHPALTTPFLFAVLRSKKVTRAFADKSIAEQEKWLWSQWKERCLFSGWISNFAKLPSTQWFGLWIARVPIPSSVNALTAIVMINLGPHAKVFYTYIITIIIKFIVEWRAMQYHGRFIRSNYCYKRATVTVDLHNKLPRPIYCDPWQCGSPLAC